MKHSEELITKEVEILVFKTNAPLNIDRMMVTDALSEVIGLEAWNFDLEDCDRIFRVVSKGIDPNEVISIMKRIGITAIQLTD